MSEARVATYALEDFAPPTAQGTPTGLAKKVTPHSFRSNPRFADKLAGKHLSAQQVDAFKALHDIELETLNTKTCPSAGVAALAQMQSNNRSNDALRFAIAAFEDGMTVSDVCSILAQPRFKVSAHALADKHANDRMRPIARAVAEAILKSKVLKRPIIDTSTGNLMELATKLEEVLIAGDVPLFQSGGRLVTPVAQPSPDPGNDNRISFLVDVNEEFLKEHASIVATWMQGSEKQHRHNVPPVDIIKSYLHRVGRWTVPVINGIISSPTLALDGSIIEKPGFDVATGYFLSFSSGKFPVIPQAPTEEDARRAVQLFVDLLRDFPFIEPEDLSVALSAFFTCLIVRSLGRSPLHAFDSPTRRTGKTYLAELIGYLVAGICLSSIDQDHTDKELDNLIDGQLIEGGSLIFIDNCDRPLHTARLCRAVTGSDMQIRNMHTKSQVHVRPNVLFLASGNNFTVRGDMPERTLKCRLDAKVERPDQRSLPRSPNRPLDILMRDRGKYGAAVLTALRAYKQLPESQKPKFTRQASFPEWDWVRGMLIWLGYADPLRTQKALIEDDVDRAQSKSLQSALEQAFGTMIWDSKDVRTKVAGSSSKPCDEALIQWIGDNLDDDEFNGRKFGNKLRPIKDQIIDGRVLRKVGESKNGAKWKIEIVAAV